jgi:hypothetical protein
MKVDAAKVSQLRTRHHRVRPSPDLFVLGHSLRLNERSRDLYLFYFFFADWADEVSEASGSQ